MNNLWKTFLVLAGVVVGSSMFTGPDFKPFTRGGYYVGDNQEFEYRVPDEYTEDQEEFYTGNSAVQHCQPNIDMVNPKPTPYVSVTGETNDEDGSYCWIMDGYLPPAKNINNRDGITLSVPNGVPVYLPGENFVFVPTLHTLSTLQHNSTSGRFDAFVGTEEYPATESRGIMVTYESKEYNVPFTTPGGSTVLVKTRIEFRYLERTSCCMHKQSPDLVRYEDEAFLWVPTISILETNTPSAYQIVGATGYTGHVVGTEVLGLRTWVKFYENANWTAVGIDDWFSWRLPDGIAP